MMRSLSGDTVENVLRWLDLASHLRLREASPFDRDETPRRTTTLVARDCEQARRCQEKIFTRDKKTRLQSITLDLAAPNTSRSGCGSRRTSDGVPSTQHLSSYNSYFSSFLDESSGAVRRVVLPFLVREHRPTELRFKNMVRGGEFSDALLSLEDNLHQIRRELRVLDLGLATGGPRPYQDSRSHYWCMLRLRRVLGSGPSGVGGRQAGEEEAAIGAELARLTNELLGEAAATATMPHLVGVAEPTEGQETVPAPRSAPAAGLQACWPRLAELRLSCGIVSGDLDSLATCLGSLPALEVLVLAGHSYRAPPTNLVALGRALRGTSALSPSSCSSSSSSPCSAASSAKTPSSPPGWVPAPPVSRPWRLKTLSLKHFKVEGVAGVAALGDALSADRFPRLSSLSMDSCRLDDKQLSVLAAALPSMSRELKALSLRSNYALGADGVSALAEALRTGSGSGVRCCGGGSCPALPTSPFAGTCLPPPPPPSLSPDIFPDADAPVVSGGGGGGGGSYVGSQVDCAAPTAKPPLPERAPAWCVPLPPPSAPPQSPPRPVSSVSPPCGCRRRHRRLPPADVDDYNSDSAAKRVLSPLMIESLDLSYSCWWSRPQRAERTGGEVSGGPFESLFRVIREGEACASLRSLGLQGCYLGDSAVRQLVAALKSEGGSCRELRELKVNGNLFGEIGVRLFADAFRARKMPPRLRMVVFCRDAKPSHRDLHADMPLEEVEETVGFWSEHQNGVHTSIHSLG
ncbi:unnamed protein product [Scytosiphon promiscuus]